MEHAQAFEPVQDGRIYIEKINEPLRRQGDAGRNISAGLKLAIERGWLKTHESGTFVTFTPADLEMFA